MGRKTLSFPTSVSHRRMGLAEQALRVVQEPLPHRGLASVCGRATTTSPWMDEIHFAPPEKPWNDDFHVSINK